MKRRKKILSCPSTFLALQVQSVVSVSASVWSVQFGHFLVFVLLTPGAPCHAVICKSGGTCTRALDGVNVTFVLQFHTKKHDKTAIISECSVTRTFPVFAFKITHRVILLTRFCNINQSRHAVWGEVGHVPQVPQWHDASGFNDDS